MTVYFLSGLGADERTFQKLQLPATWVIKYIHWPPLHSSETLETYCDTICGLIDSSSQFALVGLSFGGIVATGLAKRLKPFITIIISSVSSKKELPSYYKIVALLKINKLIPSRLLNKVYPFTYWFFGTKTPDEKALLRQIIADTDTLFLKWAINEIIHWRNTERPQNLFHIHGTKDRLFPLHNVHADVKIKGGGHFMVYSNAEEISLILKDKLGYT